MRNQRFTIASLLLAYLLLATGMYSVLAQWAAISSGYAVTTNWHGKDVPLGSSVTATAGTTDSNVKTVEFVWKDPTKDVVRDVTVSIEGPLTSPDVPAGATPEIIDWANNNRGVVYYYAQDTQTPNVVGDWGVQAIFHDNNGNERGRSDNEFISIRATGFFVIPEVQLGALGISAIFLTGLLVFAATKRKAIRPLGH
jgi:hypothetical protein